MSLSFFLSLAILLAAFACGLWVLLSTRYRPVLLPEDAAWLTREELANFEERLKGCEEVVLLADRVEIPTREHLPEFLRAVIDNFAERVRYRFLVPPGFYDEHETEVTESYQAVVSLVRASEGIELEPTELFRLVRRPHELAQPDYPYLFYRYRDDVGRISIVAFRGEEVGRGIASDYRRLEPEVAKTILSQAMPYLRSREESATLADVDFVKENTPIDLDEVRRRKAVAQ